MVIKAGMVIEFDYVNWRGDVGHRVARVLEFLFESNMYHTTPQWILRALDLDKDEVRTFAMSDMTNIEIVDSFVPNDYRIIDYSLNLLTELDDTNMHNFDKNNMYVLNKIKRFRDKHIRLRCLCDMMDDRGKIQFSKGMIYSANIRELDLGIYRIYATGNNKESYEIYTTSESNRQIPHYVEMFNKQFIVVIPNSTA